MKIKTVLLTIYLSIGACYAQTFDDTEWMQSVNAMIEAQTNPIIIKTYNDSCYLEQHFYKDGSLFSEVPIINGKKTGTYKEYWLNGQIHKQYDFIDGHRTDSTTEISYYFDGSYQSILIYIDFRKRKYSCRTDYFLNKRSDIFIHEMPHQNRMVAEYIFEDGRWKKRPYHVKPVRYAYRLFQIYRKEWKKKYPNIEF